MATARAKFDIVGMVRNPLPKSRMACSTALLRPRGCARRNRGNPDGSARSAFGSGFVRDRQTRRVKQPVENGEVRKEAVGEDAVEIELQIAELDQARAIAQETQDTAVGDDPVELIVKVDELLYEGMSGHAEGRHSRVYDQGRRARGSRRSVQGP